MLTKPDTYVDLVARYNLTVATKPGDWKIVGGDLDLTKDGDIAVGDPAYNALYRLIEAWCLSKSVGTGPRIGVQLGPLRKLGTARLS